MPSNFKVLIVGNPSPERRAEILADMKTRSAASRRPVVATFETPSQNEYFMFYSGKLTEYRLSGAVLVNL